MKTIFLLCSLMAWAQAQLIVNLKPEKGQFVINEDVTVILAITNRAGKTITLRGKDRLNWLNMDLRGQGGEILPYKGKIPTFKAVTIAAGQTVKKKIVISDFYNLTRYGRYQASAHVKLPGEIEKATRSNNSQFLVTTGKTLFTQKIGMPNTGSARKYEVINFNGAQHTMMYIQVTNTYTGETLVCKPLSQLVLFREPKASLDGNNYLHLLYLATPTLYTHIVVTPSGKIAKREYHKQGALGEPRLLSFANGDVKVAGTIPYNPTKAQQEKDGLKKLSDRPKIVF